MTLVTGASFHDPADGRPVGGSAGAPRAVAGAPGEWVVWSNSAGGPGGLPIVTYVASEPRDSVTFDLKAFIDDAVTLGTSFTSVPITRSSCRSSSAGAALT